ncbi:MAG: hypothetical protein JOZ45_10435 [Acidobacteriaceae bacterium]|nr:hypothetical protein [Acidobacteriaceae bacterium]MBV9306549.1 hypothetical protein [Acidobacteriaceae bacterium]MBV9937382.1 hypothetical protein [Acidobacteriaceae bacterium]
MRESEGLCTFRMIFSPPVWASLDAIAVPTIAAVSEPWAVTFVLAGCGKTHLMLGSSWLSRVSAGLAGLLLVYFAYVAGSYLLMRNRQSYS